MAIQAGLVALLLSTAFAAPSPNYQAPYHHAPSDGVEGEYVVSFSENHSLEKHYDFIGKNLSASFDRFYDIPLINAYHIACDESTIHDLVRADPGVRKVAQNVKVYRVESDVDEDSTDMPEPPRYRHDQLQKRFAYQNVFPGRGQITSQWWPMLTKKEKIYDPPAPGVPYGIWRDAGKGVNLYVMDDGILLSHDAFIPDPDDIFNEIIGDTEPHAINFQGKSTSDYVFPPQKANPTPGGLDAKHGCHGTHVASLAGGLGYGTARGTMIINVRVLDDNGEGTAANWARAINDIVTEHQANEQKGDPKFRGSVINMSLSSTVGEEGSENMQTLKDAIDVALKAGIPVVVAAGNQGQNSDKTPAVDQRYPCQWSKTTDLICVGNVNFKYQRADSSNRGSTVTIWAPGDKITGAYCRNDSQPIVMGGTSQASPFVAGIVAGYVGYELITDVSKVKARLLQNANNYVDSFGSTDLIANTGINKRNYNGPYFNAPSQSAAHKAAATAAAAVKVVEDAVATNTTAPATGALTTSAAIISGNVTDVIPVPVTTLADTTDDGNGFPSTASAHLSTKSAKSDVGATASAGSEPAQTKSAGATVTKSSDSGATESAASAPAATKTASPAAAKSTETATTKSAAATSTK